MFTSFMYIWTLDHTWSLDTFRILIGHEDLAINSLQRCRDLLL